MHHFEALELAARVVGIDPDASDFDEEVLEQKLYDALEVDVHQFQKIAEALLPFTIPAETALTKTVVQGYIYGGSFICKQPVKKESVC